MRRFLAGLEAAHPKVTIVLEFEPGEAGQVGFGKGPEVLDATTGELLSTWIFAGAPRESDEVGDRGLDRGALGGLHGESLKPVDTSCRPR